MSRVALWLLGEYCVSAEQMAWAYEWAADNGPMHRLYFSLFLTCASAALALLVSTQADACAPAPP